MRPLAPIIAVLASLLASCEYAGPFITETTDVRLHWTSGPSTTVYEASGAAGHYRFANYDGTATQDLTGGADFGLAQGKATGDSRGLAQPLCTDAVVFTKSGAGAQLAFADGRTCRLEFVTGSWADFSADREVVLKFADPAWHMWTEASHAAFSAVLYELQADVRRILEPEDSLSELTVEPLLVRERPLVRAGRGRLLVFFEPMEMQGGFAIETRRPDPDEEWWVSNYDLTPGSRQFFEEAGQVTGQIALGALYGAVIVLDAMGRCACH